MTISDMHIAINLEMDKTQDFEVAYMMPEQIDYWLNKAIKRFVKTRYGGDAAGKNGYEQTEKRIDDLRTVTNYPQNSDGSPIVLAVTLVGLNYYQALPSDYWFLVRLDITTQVGNCVPEIQPGTQVKQDTLNVIQEDPFNRAYNEIPTYYLIGNNLVYPTDGSFKILGTTPYYIRRPTAVQLGTQYQVVSTDISSDFPDHLHDEIVDLTAQMILENIEQTRLQTFSAIARGGE